MKKLILTFLFIPIISNLYCQVINISPGQDSSILYEKLYLHIDRELYSPGDDIWFKSYLVNGTNNQLIPDFRNIYVQLIAEDGRVIDQRLMLSLNGTSNNDFHLPDTLPKGQYIVRAFTKYLQNFGEESLFHQKIAVSEATNLSEFEEKPEEQKIIDVSFLPEGGNLVMNTANYIAFKAINEKGEGMLVTGKIIDENGQEIVAFESRYNGMGMFVMIPGEGKKYHAQVDNYPDFIYQFKEAQKDGIALHYRKEKENLLFILSRAIKSVGVKNFALVVSHGGDELFREEIEMTGFQYPVEIYKGFFPEGISKVTIMDLQNNILAERIVFVRNADDKTLLITSDKNEYQLKEKVTLKIESLFDSEVDNIESGLSLAVVNEDYFSGDGRNQTIESYLLLDSELKGSLESPASYFIDEEDITSEEKLDLVMMVNGWRRYYPDVLKDYFGKPLPGRDDVGLTLRGEVKTLFGGNPVEGGTVELGPFSGLFLILKDTTDESGRFSFNHLYLQDSAQIMVNAWNKNGRNNNVEIFAESTPVFDSIAPVIEITEIKRGIREIEVPKKFDRSSYNRYLAESEFKLEEGSILIKEVEVEAERKSPATITGFYGFANRSITLTDADRKRYVDVKEYLEFEVAGVIDYGDGLRIGFGKDGPKWFVDGYDPAFSITDIPMDDIEKIEIINPSRIAYLMSQRTPSGGGVYDVNKAGFGTLGGVISILTKTGFGKFNNEFERIIHGRITPRVKGFRQAREFYSPTYPLTELDNVTKKPDQRPTLYWNPDVLLENGKAELEFFTSDMAGKYRVIVEGISKNGKACYGTALLNVGSSK